MALPQDIRGGPGGGMASPGRMTINNSRFKHVYISTTGMGRRNQLVTNIPLILDEELTMTLSSQFSSVMQSSDSFLSRALTMLGTMTRDIGFGFSGQFDWQGYQMWTGTDPISLTLNFTFHVGCAGLNDAKKEVYEPIIALAKLPLPRAGIGGNLTPPGPSLLTLLSGTDARQTTAGIITSIRIANILALANVIVKRAEPTFSSEFDVNGYPIWGKISIEIETLHTASQQLLDFNEFGSGSAADQESSEWADV